ncbi:MAG: lytic transglycosylase domain-containing protein [Deltaproteobacteria bacterium]|nr:MAG: lytic transglycosylase domain-containing protein [Deltaproteobacteria bacterium]
MPLPMTRRSPSTGTWRASRALRARSSDADGLRSRAAFRIVAAMRPGTGEAVLAMVLGFVPAASADIYSYLDGRGVRHFTNVSAVPGSRLVIRERPLPPGTPMLVPGRPRWFPALLSRPLPRADATVYDGLIRDIAARHGVEYALVKAVIKAESDFDRTAVSRAGALGLMQLMPQTAASHQVRNVFLPRDNIEGGCRHLRMLLDRYGGNLPLVVAAYNAGTQRVEDAGGVPPIAETREYLARVLRYRAAYLSAALDVVAAGR